MQRLDIVVGTDGSPVAQAAVRWAAQAAHRRGVPLRLMYAHEATAHFAGDEQFRAMALRQAQDLLAEAERAVRAIDPALVVRPEPVLGAPTPTLLQAAGSAALLVVGNRGRGGFVRLLLGSVGQRIAAHAPCPVAVVRGRTDAAEGPVVVGADGSPAGTSAVGLAFEHAAARGCALRAIRVYLPSPAGGPDVSPPDDPQRRELDDLLAPWRNKYPQVAVEALVIRSNAARVLVGVSHTAQLVVLGRRGHGTVAGTALGSVGLQLLHHADCPVLIAHA